MPAPETKSHLELLRGLARGLSADVVGGPVDMAESVVNAALMGGGTLGHKLGLLSADQLPEPLSGSVGGSDWFARNTPLAGSGPEYESGRLLPMIAGLARGAQLGRGAPKSAPTGPESQRGQLRVGGDPSLMPSHEMESDSFAYLLGKNEGNIPELYSPSIGVTRNSLMSHFGGDAHLIPRVGAFDPATYPTTLFNRDAYTTRHSGFQGRTHVAVPRVQPAFHTHDAEDFDAHRLTGSFKGLVPTTDTNSDAAYVLRNLQGMEDSGQLQAYRELAERGEIPALGDWKGWQDFEAKGAHPWALDVRDALRDSMYFYRHWGTPSKAGLKRAASDRLFDRFLDPAATRNQESKTGKGPSGLHGLAIRSSPAFRSFEQYEKSPLGSALLNWDDERLHQIRAETTLRDAVPEVRFFPQDMYDQPEFPELLANRRAIDLNIDRGIPVNPADHLRAINQALGKFRKEIARTPSQYGELKAVGPVPVTPDSFAGVILQGGHNLDNYEAMTDSQRAVFGALKDRGLQAEFMPPDQEDPQGTLFEIARRMQEQAGPARRHPLK